jgi:hypothetical protein
MRFQNPHLDAAENAFLERKLEYVKAKTYEKRYPEFKARRFIPVSHEVPSGAESISYEEYDGVGVAKLLASYADDLPRADVFAKKVVSPIKGIGSAYGYNLQEIRAAMMANRPRAAQKASRAARAVEQVQDSVAARGGFGLVGLLTIPNALAYTVPNGAGGVATWIAGAGKTAAEILKDMHGIAQYIVNQTNEVERPDTMLLPAEHYGHIAVTRIDNTSETTILQHFLKTNPYITSVDSWGQCKGAGAALKDRMVVYKRDPDYLTLEIPQEFEQLTPEQRGLETLVACHARTGGVICPIPMSIAYGDGI